MTNRQFQEMRRLYERLTEVRNDMHVWFMGLESYNTMKHSTMNDAVALAWKIAHNDFYATWKAQDDRDQLDRCTEEATSELQVSSVRSADPG